MLTNIIRTFVKKIKNSNLIFIELNNFITFKKLNLSIFTISQYNNYIFILLTNVLRTLFTISQ